MNGKAILTVVALALLGCSGGSADKAACDCTSCGDSAGADMSARTDAGNETIGPSDVTSGCQPGHGCFLEPCENNWDCESGLCVGHLGDRVCSRACADDCPHNWDCLQLAGRGGAVTEACFSIMANLCLPCMSSGDCNLAGVHEGSCVPYEDGNSFCTSNCASDACPEGFGCKKKSTLEGEDVFACVATDGICPCSDYASSAGLVTGCQISNEFGTCSGNIGCGPGGLSQCDASTPAGETCNGVDDDCNGLTDDALCDDENPCTTDSCDGESGCVFTNNNLHCNDGDPCTVDDICKEGACTPGTTVNCNDGDPCTDDSCDPEEGCIYSDNIAWCNDGDLCTKGDFCKGGQCMPGSDIACDDGNICTDDSCENDVGCVFTPNPNPCDDDNVCTTKDHCVEGACISDASLECDDANPCTVDTCDPATGCTYGPAEALCSDGSACTVIDKCLDGECASGDAITCNDGNECTDDSCAAEIGCLYTPNADYCNDSNPCTVLDKCINGICVGADPKNCDDGDNCTVDMCTYLTGCIHVKSVPCCGNDDVEDGEQCDDGNLEGGDGCDAVCNKEPAISCKTLHEEDPYLLSGVYKIDADGPGGQPPFDVYCDMITNGGGWTLVLKLSSNEFCYNSVRWTDQFPHNEQFTLDSVMPAGQEYDAKSRAYDLLHDVSSFRITTSRGGTVFVSFAEEASPRLLITTNEVEFSQYPEFAEWRDAFGITRECAPVFMRAGEYLTEGSCRSYGLCPSGCGKPCMFCFQSADGDYGCPAGPGGCGDPGKNDVSAGLGLNSQYCGGGDPYVCSTAAEYADKTVRSIIWAR